MTTFYRATLALLVLGILCISTRGVGKSKHDKATQPAARISEHIKALDSKDRHERQSAYKQAIKQRQNNIATLIALAQKQLKGVKVLGSGDPALYAIRLLGEYRAAEAVPFLLKNIALPYGGEVDSRSLLGPNPCAQSLVKIGKPASKACIRRLSRPTGSERETWLLVQVVKQVEGKEIARQMILQAIKTQPHPKKLKTSNSVLNKYFRK